MKEKANFNRVNNQKCPILNLRQQINFDRLFSSHMIICVLTIKEDIN
jgi:hypothetical protein